MALDVKSFCICVALLGSFFASFFFYPQPSHPSWLGKYVVSILVSTVLVVAADSVVMDTLRVRLSLICGFTFLSGTIPKAHLLLMGLMFFTNSFLLLICRQGHLEMVVYLMKQGADPASLDIEGSVTLELSLKKCFAV